MISICPDCNRIRNTKLPSDFDPAWLSHEHPSVDYRCESCYWKAMAAITNWPIEVEVHKHYLMPYRQVIPFLASVAFIIMLCLVIAVHI